MSSRHVEAAIIHARAAEQAAKGLRQLSRHFTAGKPRLKYAIPLYDKAIDEIFEAIRVEMRAPP